MSVAVGFIEKRLLGRGELGTIIAAGKQVAVARGLCVTFFGSLIFFAFSHRQRRAAVTSAASTAPCVRSMETGLVTQLLHIAVQSCGDGFQSIDFDATPAVFVMLDQPLCDADAAREFGLCHARGLRTSRSRWAILRSIGPFTGRPSRATTAPVGPWSASQLGLQSWSAQHDRLQKAAQRHPSWPGLGLRPASAASNP